MNKSVSGVCTIFICSLCYFFLQHETAGSSYSDASREDEIVRGDFSGATNVECPLPLPPVDGLVRHLHCMSCRGYRMLIMPYHGPNLLDCMDALIQCNHGLSPGDCPVHKRRGMPVDDVRRIVKHLLRALCSLESRAVVHCDIKPENVLLTSKLGMEAAFDVTLIDFSCSRPASHGQGSDACSDGYRPPEVQLGKRWGCKVDMYSLGCTAFYALVGTPLQFSWGDTETGQDLCTSPLCSCPRKKVDLGPVPSWLTESEGRAHLDGPSELDLRKQDSS